MAKTDFKSIDEYIAAQKTEFHEALQTLRQQIRALAPEAEEFISYQIPMFRWSGAALCGFAAFSAHCSFTTANGSTLETFREALLGFRFSPSAVRFTPQKPLPPELLERIVRQRMAENEARAAAKVFGKRSS